jgi:quercetin dioxygenase-like cupin family protein
VKRFITSHNENGKAIFAAAETEEVNLKFAKPAEIAAMHVHYATQGFPVQLNGDQDLKAFFESADLPISTKNGSVIRMVDIRPGEQSPMHRTQSLDYGVVLAGEVELVLEDWDGPVRHMHVGDVSVQRGTMHAWRNASKDKWARMLYVLVPSEPLEFGGKKLDENYGGIVLPK